MGWAHRRTCFFAENWEGLLNGSLYLSLSDRSPWEGLLSKAAGSVL